MKKYNKILMMIATLMANSVAFAQEATAHAEDGSGHALGMAAIGAGIAIGIAALGGAFGQGKAAAAALDGVARNPAASGKLLLPLVLSLALIESLVIYAFVISFQLNGLATKLLAMMGK